MYCEKCDKLGFEFCKCKKSRIYKLSNGLEIRFYQPPDKMCTFVNGTIFPGFKLDACCSAFKAIWTTLGITWEEIN